MADTKSNPWKYIDLLLAKWLKKEILLMADT